jgi:hypothetical protein
MRHRTGSIAVSTRVASKRYLDGKVFQISSIVVFLLEMRQPKGTSAREYSKGSRKLKMSFKKIGNACSEVKKEAVEMEVDTHESSVCVVDTSVKVVEEKCEEIAAKVKADGVDVEEIAAVDEEMSVVSLVEDLDEFDDLEDLDEVKDFLYLDNLNIDLKSFEETELDQLQAYSVQASVQPEVVGCVQANVQAEVAQPEVVGCVQASVQPEVAQNAVSYSSAVCSQLVIQGPVEIDAKSLGGKLVLGAGFHDEPDPKLLAASLGDDKPRSHVNDGWALRQAGQLRRKLNWDMSIPLGDLPFKQLDLLFSRLLATSVRKDGRAYPQSDIDEYAQLFVTNS